MLIRGFILLLFSILSLSVSSQTTLNCLEVESILVDACSPDAKEGQNEMVRILAGPNNLTVNNIVPVWPNHAFGGWIMNAITAQKTTELNAGINSCGWLLEPLSGFVPANKKAILVTSWDMNTTANSFAGLSDTMYIIYQNTQRGNAGHFANSGTGFRTLTINYPSCSETVTYNRSLLVGGDGAFVNFAQNGSATYGNNGCSAPIVPFQINAGNNPAAICVGNPASLAGSVIGSSNYIQWSGGSGVFSQPGSLSTSYTPSAGESGSFWVFLSVKGVCPDTLRDSVLITVNPSPSIQLNQSDFSLCIGNTATLSATGSGTINWSGGQTGNSITINSAGQYIASVTNICGVAADTVNITSAPLPTVQIDQTDFSLCDGNTATLSATGSGIINWTGGQTGNSITINSAGQYIASVTNSCATVSDTLMVSGIQVPSVSINETNFSLCEGASSVITVTATDNVNWSNGQSGNSITINSPGNYTATVSNSCGTAVDSIWVTGVPLPIVLITQSDFTICEGVSAQINATGTGVISWNNGQTGNAISINSAGLFIASVTNSCGTFFDTVQVSFTPLPFVTISPQSAIYCIGTPLVLTAQSNAPVSWNGSAPSPSFSVNSSGVVVASVSNSCGTAADTISVAAGVLPQVQISGPSGVSICQGSSYTFSGAGSGTLLWSNQTSGTSITVSASGNYFLVSQTECGSDTAFVNITVSSPDASFTASPPMGNIPLTVQTANQSSGGQTYYWASGNGQTSDSFSPSFDYNEPGEYFLGLWVTDTQGCMDSAFIEILVYESMEVFMPNVFTPNGDNVNDEYFVVTKGISDFRIFIFNRWGERVFESVSPDMYWDGTAPFGNEAVDGVYFGVVTVKDYYGKSHEFNSSITLVR